MSLIIFYKFLENKEPKQKKTKKVKKEKDPNAPKKSLTAFLYFVQKSQKDYKAANPNLVHKEVIAKMGEAWHTLSDKEKKQYNDLAATDKARYEKQKTDYQNTLKKGGVAKKAPAGKATAEKKAKEKKILFSFLNYLIRTNKSRHNYDIYKKFLIYHNLIFGLQY